MPAFHLVSVSWGQSHTDLFLDVSLPTQLAPGNLPALADCPGTIYKIYTTAADAQRIQQSPIYHELCRTLRTEIIEIQLDTNLDRYHMMTNCHRMALADASEAQAAIVYLMPDMLLSDGAFARMRELADEGKKVVFTTGMRLTKETYLSHFLQRFRPNGEMCVQVSARELLRESLDHLHPFPKACFWPPKVNWPSTTYWAVKDEGIISRSFHLHTLMVVVPKQRVTFTKTFDYDYIDRAYPDGGDFYVVQDSDEITILEISPQAHASEALRSDAMGTISLAMWAKRHCTANHRWLYEHSIRIHSGPCSPRWEAMDLEVRRRADLILWLVKSRAFGLVCLIYRVFYKTARALALIARVCRSRWLKTYWRVRDPLLNITRGIPHFILRVLHLPIGIVRRIRRWQSRNITPLETSKPEVYTRRAS